MEHEARTGDNNYTTCTAFAESITIYMKVVLEQSNEDPIHMAKVTQASLGREVHCKVHRITGINKTRARINIMRKKDYLSGKCDEDLAVHKQTKHQIIQKVREHSCESSPGVAQYMITGIPVHKFRAHMPLLHFWCTSPRTTPAAVSPHCSTCQQCQELARHAPAKPITWHHAPAAAAPGRVQHPPHTGATQAQREVQFSGGRRRHRRCSGCTPGKGSVQSQSYPGPASRQSPGSCGSVSVSVSAVHGV